MDPDTLAMVKAFLKMPTDQLPAEHIPKFLAVDPDSLPVNLRERFLAKKVELYSLKQIADGNKRGSVRMPQEDCAVSKDARSPIVKLLRMAGYLDITEDEEKFVMDHTHCTEHDLMCEFTLQVVAEPVGKKKEVRRKLLLHVRDPLMTLVGQYRDQGREKQTNFFGMMGASCAPRIK